MCFTTGKMLRMSSSVNTVLCSESKWYSLKRIWRREWDELAIRVKEMHRHCPKKIMLNHVYYKLIYLNASFDGDLSEQGDPLQPAFIHSLLHSSTARKRWDPTRITSHHHSTASICVQRTGHSPGQAVMVVLLSFSFDGPPKVSWSEVGQGGHSAAHGRTTPPSPTPASRS